MQSQVRCRSAVYLFVQPQVSTMPNVYIVHNQMCCTVTLFQELKDFNEKVRWGSWGCCTWMKAWEKVFSLCT